MASIEYRKNRNGVLVSIRVRVTNSNYPNSSYPRLMIKNYPLPDSVFKDNKRHRGISKLKLKEWAESQKVTFVEECNRLLQEEKILRSTGIDPDLYINCLFRTFAKEAVRLKRRENLSETTLKRYEDMLEDRILPYLGDYKLTEITGTMIDQFYDILLSPGENKKTGEQLSNKTVREYHNVLSSVFELAVKKRLIKENPVRSASPPNHKKAFANYYQPEEISKIIEETNKLPIKWKTMIYIMMILGIRRGECAGIKIKNIHFEDRYILIDSCVYHNSKLGTFEKPTTKNDKPRTLPISENLEKLIRQYLDWRSRQADAYGDLWQESGHLFTSETGGMINPDTITQYLNRLSKKMRKTDADFPHLNPHAFRHSAASNLIADGVDIITVADYLGDTPNTISNHYAHLINQAKLQAGCTMNKLVFKMGEE